MGGIILTDIKHDTELLMMTERADGVDRLGRCLMRTGMQLAKVTWGREARDTRAGGQTGAEHRKDRECNTKVGEGGSLLSPVLLFHHELCSWFLMLESSRLAPL